MTTDEQQDRRDANQDAAIERAFVAGTLPEADRRAATTHTAHTEHPLMSKDKKVKAETTADEPAVSLFHVYDIMPPGTVPALDAALDAYAWRLGTPGTPAIPANPGDPLAEPPIPATPEVPAVPAVQGTLTDEDEFGVIIKTAYQAQGYAQQTLLKLLFDLNVDAMTPVPPLPAPPAADGSAVVESAAAPPTFETIP